MSATGTVFCRGGCGTRLDPDEHSDGLCADCPPEKEPNDRETTVVYESGRVRYTVEEHDDGGVVTLRAEYFETGGEGSVVVPSHAVEKLKEAL